MSVRWPEDEGPPAAPARPRQPAGLREPLGITVEIFDPAPGAGLRRSIPVLVLLGVVFVIGALAFFLGPLPTIFPSLPCGSCGIFRP